MLPTRAPRTLRVVGTFDLVTPDGQIHRFPMPGWWQRTYRGLHSCVEPVILAAVMLGLVYTTGAAFEPLQSLAADACANEIGSRPSILLWARQFAA